MRLTCLQTSPNVTASIVLKYLRALVMSREVFLRILGSLVQVLSFGGGGALELLLGEQGGLGEGVAQEVGAVLAVEHVTNFISDIVIVLEDILPNGEREVG